jgi:hypothetical protein
MKNGIYVSIKRTSESALITARGLDFCHIRKKRCDHIKRFFDTFNVMLPRGARARSGAEDRHHTASIAHYLGGLLRKARATFLNAEFNGSLTYGIPSFVLSNIIPNTADQ